MQNYKKMEYPGNTDVILRYTPGHFITPNSHVNYYIAMCDTKARMKEARAAGESLAEMYLSSDIVDTILCLNGSEVIGSYMANKLTESGVLSMNAHKTIYITGPEFNVSGQMMFRDNNQHMIRGKKVLILIDSASTGSTLKRAIESVRFFEGDIVGISAVFSIATRIDGIQIESLFTIRDLPDYASYSPDTCPLCSSKVPVDAICNGYGYSTL